MDQLGIQLALAFASKTDVKVEEEDNGVGDVAENAQNAAKKRRPLTRREPLDQHLVAFQPWLRRNS